jgi:hypothetical protein
MHEVNPMVHLIAYEIKGYRSAFHYQRLGEAIKGISGSWCHIPESKWLVETDLSTKAVSEHLAPLTQVGDPLFVTRLHRDWSGYSLTQQQISWLNGRDFGSSTDLLGSLLQLRPPLLDSLFPKPPPPTGALISAILRRS